MEYEVILASASPRRRELLSKLFAEYECTSSDIDESAVTAETTAELVKTLARLKGEDVRDRLAEEGRLRDNTLIISADTVVDLDGQVLTKPVSEDDAFAMLSALSGAEHTVYTGIAVFRGARECRSEAESTTVRFSELSERDIREYIATGDPMDKAGSYGIQGIGGKFIEGIEGDFFNVMGLPVNRLWRLLRQMGVL